MAEFVTVKRDDDVEATVPAKSVDHWQEKGWKVVETATEPVVVATEGQPVTDPALVVTPTEGTDSRTAADSAEKQGDPDVAGGRRSR